MTATSTTTETPQPLKKDDAWSKGAKLFDLKNLKSDAEVRNEKFNVSLNDKGGFGNFGQP